MPSQIDYLIALLGTATTAVVAGTFCVLVSLVARRIRRRRDFRSTWADAWLALAVGYVARAVYLQSIGDIEAGSEGPRIVLLAVAAHAGMLLGVALFAFGATLFVRTVPRQLALSITLGAVSIYAPMAAFASFSLPALIVAQAPILMIAFGWAGVTLLLLPEARRSRRTMSLAAAFGLAALLWVTWFAVFGLTLLSNGSASADLADLARFHAYWEGAALLLIGIAMLGVAMEQTSRELSDANDALAVAHDQVRRAELYDLKTGCLNKKAFDEQVGLEVARGVHGAVIMCHVEDVALIQREQGQMIVDELLWHAAQVLRDSIRPTDRLFRWRDDSFVLVLPSAVPSEVKARFERIITEAWPLRAKLARGPIKLRASIGVAPYRTAADLNAAIDRADADAPRDRDGSGASLRLVINE